MVKQQVYKVIIEHASKHWQDLWNQIHRNANTARDWQALWNQNSS